MTNIIAIVMRRNAQSFAMWVDPGIKLSFHEFKSNEIVLFGAAMQNICKTHDGLYLHWQ